MAAGEDAPPVRLHATSNHPFVDPQGREVVLRGFNTFPVWADGNGPDLDWYTMLGERGFNVVRFVMPWEWYEPRKGAFSEKHFRALDRAVAHARRAGLYVVMDTIHVDPWHGTPAGASGSDRLDIIHRNARPYLRRLAVRYRDEPAVAAYDLINEPPMWPPDHRRIMRVYDSLIRAVRSGDRRKITMVSPLFGDAIIRREDFSPLSSRRNVVFTMHDYYSGAPSGNGYTVNGDKDKGSYDFRGLGYPDRDPSVLEEHLLINLRTVRAARLPIWIGEFGMSDNVPHVAEWRRDKVALFKRYGLGYAWWMHGPRSPMHTLDGDYRLKNWVDDLR
jgi:hypothetical protein